MTRSQPSSLLGREEPISVQWNAAGRRSSVSPRHQFHVRQMPVAGTINTNGKGCSIPRQELAGVMLTLVPDETE